jgi:hypothetical protein
MTLIVVVMEEKGPTVVDPWINRYSVYPYLLERGCVEGVGKNTETVLSVSF